MAATDLALPPQYAPRSEYRSGTLLAPLLCKARQVELFVAFTPRLNQTIRGEGVDLRDSSLRFGS